MQTECLPHSSTCFKWLYRQCQLCLHNWAVSFSLGWLFQSRCLKLLLAVMLLIIIISQTHLQAEAWICRCYLLPKPSLLEQTHEILNVKCPLLSLQLTPWWHVVKGRSCPQSTAGDVLTQSHGLPAQKLTQCTFMGMGLKGHLMVISSSPCLLFSVVSNPIHSSYEEFPMLSWYGPHCWTGFTQKSACVNQAQNCHQAACESATFPKAEGKQQDPMAHHVVTAVFLGPACAEEGKPHETLGTRGSSGDRLWLCQLGLCRSHPDVETATANKKLPQSVLNINTEISKWLTKSRALQ